MKQSAWHTKLPNTPRVYHDETLCTEGNNIEPRNRVGGTDNRPKCSRCRLISG